MGTSEGNKMVKKSTFSNMLFNTQLWMLTYLAIMIILCVAIAVYGWDAGVHFTSVSLTLHYRTGILFLGIGLVAILKFRKLTSNILTCYISVVLAYGAYGISELYVAVPEIFAKGFLIGSIYAVAELSKNMFYWLFYLFQLVVVYIFTNSKPKLINGIWDSSKLKLIIAMSVASLIMMLFGSYVVRPLYGLEKAFILNFISKLTLTLAFLIYIYAWKKTKNE